MRRLREVKTKVKSNFNKVNFEMIVGVPLITQIGNRKIIIENYKNIVEVLDKSIKVNTSVGVMHIEGDELTVREMTSETLIIEGRILKLELI